MTKKTPYSAGSSDYVTADISEEEWREIDVDGRSYRIDSPVTLVFRKGGTTHRVVDAAGVVHCYAAPESGRSVVRWKSRDGFAPIRF